MPAPTTCEELLELIRRSGVVDDSRLRTYVQKLTESGGLPADPQKFAGLLVRDGILTYFQAEQLLQGKYKRFSLGKYKVLERLGAGGMAQVFLCEHKLMRRRVAIKVLPIPKAEDPSSLERFYREARAIAAVDHPNIVRAYDIDQDENLHFLVMEYVDGTNLQDLVKKFGPLDVIRACHYIYGAAVGLQHAHEIGLVHRDIKPGNILIDRAGVVKILDMGLARFFHDEEDVLTKKYDENVLGTADYLAPEQALDSHAVDIRADIYSLGATFYYLLTGSAPFPEGSVAQKLIWHQHRQPRPVTSLRPDAPEEVVAIINKMMAKDPSKRYQTPAEVMAALASWVATPIPPPSEGELPRHSPAAAVAPVRGPATMSGNPTRTDLPSRTGNIAEANAPTVIAHGGTGSTPAAVATPHAPGTTAAIWESIETDTQTVAQGDTDRPSTATEPLSRRLRAAPNRAAWRVPIYVSAAVLLLVGLACGIYFLFFNKSSNPIEPPPPATARKIIVSKAGGENTVSTLREALSRAEPGCTIVIAEPRLSEPGVRLHAVKHRDLTIESAIPDSKPAIIEAAGTVPTLLDAINVEGLSLRNLEFDGRGVTETAIVVSGACPGTTIQNVTIRGVKSAGVELRNVRGDPNRPVVIDRLRVTLVAGATGVHLLSEGAADTQRAVVRNSRFEGPGRAGIRLDGTTKEVLITGNRFLGNNAAVVFPRLTESKPFNVQVIQNTVYQAGVGFLFDFAPAEQRGKLDVALMQNYFARTPALASASAPGSAISGVTSADNAYDPANSAPGNFPLVAVPLPKPTLPQPDPNNDTSFLRFPDGPPLMGPNRVKVGAQ